jgi:hypothetical protein
VLAFAKSLASRGLRTEQFTAIYGLPPRSSNSGGDIRQEIRNLTGTLLGHAGHSTFCELCHGSPRTPAPEMSGEDPLWLRTIFEARVARAARVASTTKAARAAAAAPSERWLPLSTHCSIWVMLHSIYTPVSRNAFSLSSCGQRPIPAPLVGPLSSCWIGKAAAAQA